MKRIVLRCARNCLRDTQSSSQSLRRPLYLDKELRACSQGRTRLNVNSCINTFRFSHTNTQTDQVNSIHSSWNAWVVLCILASGAAVGIELVSQPAAQEEPAFTKEEVSQTSPISQSELDESLSSLFASMAPPPGTLENLSAEQEAKLKDFWTIVLKTFGVKDPSDINGTDARPVTPAHTSAPAEPESHKKEKRGLFHRRNKESTSSGPGSPSSSNDPEDKYGQTRELQEILASSKPEDLRAAFWSMVKNDHPDALLLRFLRARKWDINRALAMMISTMHWRRNEMHVDDDIMVQGEGGALKDSQSSDASVKKEAHDFLQQMRLGKSFIHGVDKEGRPMCYVRVRLHRGGEQTEKALERYTVYTIETCRLALTPPVETAVSTSNL